MRDSYSENWWTDLRWRVGNQFVLWGCKVMPDGDAKGALLDAILAWAEKATQKWWLHEEEAKEKADV